jgi:hypothetical protein
MADITLQTETAPTTPASGNVVVFADSTTKALKSKNDAGVVTDYTAPGNAISSITGDGTATGPGAAALTLSDTAVTAKLLTGYVAGSGTVSAADSLLAAIQKIAGKTSSANFGNGVDGIQTITSDFTLVRDMYYDTLTVNSGVTLFTGGFRIRVLNTCTITGKIDRSGAPGVTSAAVAGLVAGTTGISGAGGAGGGAAAGSAGTATTASVGTGGGAGGSGAGGAGGAAGATTVPTAALGGVERLNAVTGGTICRDLANTVLNGGSGGGGGGGSGVASSGGAGGAGGGVLMIAARTLTGAGIIAANGGAGAAGQLVNGGGGGGGGGGVIVTITENDVTATSLVFQVNGGVAGGGLGSGSVGTTGSLGRAFKLRS